MNEATPVSKRWGLILGIVLAGLIVTIAVTSLCRRYDASYFGRYRLWAFDSHAYVAMAEQPAYFTVAPWGFRILTPYLVHCLRPRNAVRGFRLVTIAGLWLAGMLLYFFMRSLGHRAMPSLVGVAIFVLSDPFACSLRDYVNVEPVAVALQIAFFLALERHASLASLAFLATFLSLGKETGLLLLPLVFLTYRRRGLARALGATAVVGLPMLAVLIALRASWAPYIHVPHAPITLDTARLGWSVFLEQWRLTWPALLLKGVVPLAMIGSLRKAARSFVKRYSYLIVALFGVALLSWLNVPSTIPSPHYGDNTMRLAIYPLPLLLALALYVFKPSPARQNSGAPSHRRRLATNIIATIATIGCLVFPFLGLDRYRRIPLHHRRDGRLVLTLCRESLKTARQLKTGKQIEWDLDQPGFESSDDPREMPRMRWFLREGWIGRAVQYGSAPVEQKGPRASFLLPILQPAPTRLSLNASGRGSLRVLLNDTGVAGFRLSPTSKDFTLIIPSRTLFRGDNVVSLQRASAEDFHLRLHRIVLDSSIGAGNDASR